MESKIRPGQLRRWRQYTHTAGVGLTEEDLSELFVVLGTGGDLYGRRIPDEGCRFMRGTGALDWHWASVIEKQSDVVGD